MNIIVFEDSGIQKLFPISIGRPGYAITCASFQLVDWLTQLQGNLIGVVRPFLQNIQSLDYPQLNNQVDDAQEWTLMINARLVPSVANFQYLQSLTQNPTETSSIVCRAESGLAVGVVPTASVVTSSDEEFLSWIEGLNDESMNAAESTAPNLELFQYPHDVIRQNLNCFSDNIQHRLETNSYEEVRYGVFVGRSVQLSEQCVCDSSKGPIIIDDASTIGPFTFLRGPIYIGPNSKIIEHASVKDCASLGHTTKIGGEIEGAVIEAYSNKQHHGFLGHSYLGSWINLGAGTCNSDLKNTYGQVNMQYGNDRVSSGMQFVGCVIGDYSKTAINTGIFTGKTIGACSMVYGFVTTNVPSFVNYARSFGQTTELPPAVMHSTQNRMFGRRNVQQRPCDIQLINDMYLATAAERQLSEEPLVL